MCEDDNNWGVNAINTEILYNKSFLTSLKLHFVINHGGPSEVKKYFNFIYLEHFKQMKIEDLFKEDSLKDILDQINLVVERKNKELLKSYEDIDENMYRRFKQPISFQPTIDKNLPFFMRTAENNGEEGINFIYEFKFRNQLHSYSPSLFFSFEELEPHLKDKIKKQLRL